MAGVNSLRAKSQPPSAYSDQHAREDAIIFGDLIGKLDLLRMECPKCGRSGRYPDLITRYGRDEKLLAFTACDSDSDPCGAICPDLPKVL